MDCERDGIGGIKGMLYNENGVGYGAMNDISSPLADDTCGLIEIPPGAPGMVEAGDEIDEVSLPIDMTMC